MSCCCSLFVVCCFVVVARLLMFVCCLLLIVVACLLFDCCCFFGVCWCLLFVVCCLFVVCLLLGWSCSVFVVCCLLFVFLVEDGTLWTNSLASNAAGKNSVAQNMSKCMAPFLMGPKLTGSSKWPSIEELVGAYCIPTCGCFIWVSFLEGTPFLILMGKRVDNHHFGGVQPSNRHA